MIASCGSEHGHERPDGADLVLTGGNIYTSNEQQPWAEAVAIKEGRFVYVGGSDGVSAYLSDGTRLVDLDGRLIIPGLIDAHAHPGYIDVEVYGEISESDEESMLESVRQYAEEHPGEGWLRLCCWPVDDYIARNRGPDKRKLDAVVPDRPVWFVSDWWHSGWLNSKALEVLGLDDDTHDPKPGLAMYKRDRTGELTGWVKEGAGWQHFAEHFPIKDDAHKTLHEKSMVDGLDTLASSGVTTLYDAGNFGFEDVVYGFMAGLEKKGDLPVRYEGTYQVFTPDRVKLAAREIKRYREEFGGERLQFNTVKLFMDGIYKNRSSAMLEPHRDDPDAIMDTMLSVDELRNFLLELHRERLDLHIHAMGDLAVRRVLDAVEAAIAVEADNFYPRVTLSHLGLIDPADLPRIKALDVISNYTPWWFTDEQGDPLKTSLGAERYEKMYSAKTLMDLGITVTFSSDEWWGGELLPTYLNPYFGMQVGHTRQTPKEWWGGDGEVARPPRDERLSMEQLIAGYTRHAAYQLRMEDRIGSIETGKLADLVVLNDNLFDMDPYAIWQVAPAAVLMEGKTVRGALPE